MASEQDPDVPMASSTFDPDIPETARKPRQKGPRPPPPTVGQGNPSTATESGGKRARVGTNTVTPPTNEPTAIQAVKGSDVEYEVPYPARLPEDNLYYIVGDLHDEATTVFPTTFYQKLAAVLDTARDHQLPGGNCVLARLFLADPTLDAMPLVRLIYRAFSDGSEPLCDPNNQGNGDVRLWVRDAKVAKGNPALLANDSMIWRSYENRSFALVSSVRSIWPPPLVCGPSKRFSVFWSFKVADRNKERASLAALATALEKRFVGCFFAKVRL